VHVWCRTRSNGSPNAHGEEESKMDRSQGMIVVHARFKLSPALEEEYARTTRENWQRSLGHEGCIEYTYARDLFDPTIIYAYQEWTSQETFDAHSVNPDHLWRNNDIDRYIDEGRFSREKIHFYTVSSIVDPLNR
jgi:quinol monooxygenase YgiN